MAPIIIRSTRVVLPSGIQPAEIEIAGDRIAAVRPLDSGFVPSSALRPPSSDLPPPASRIPPPASDLASRAPRPAPRDYGDALVMPGIVDTHVHVNEPGRADWEGFTTATAAAAAGGVTTIVDMPLNSVPATTTIRGLEAKRRVAPADGIEVAFWGGIVPGNHSELDHLAAAGVRGFKAFLSPSGVEEFAAVELHDLRRALPILARRNLPLLVHAEWPPRLRPIPLASDPRRYRTWLDSRPPEAELEAVVQIIRLCRQFAVRIHIVHLATELALPILRDARAEALPITVETCPHYLTFAAEDVGDGETWLKCAPPIRARSTREALWRGLEDGDIDMIATDHSPCPPAMKADGDFLHAWGGIASLELSLPIVWTGASERGIGPEQLVKWMCAAPARLAGLDVRKGSIAPGMDADLVVWNPDETFVVDEAALRQRHKRTPYHGRQLRGRVVATYARGRVVYGDTGA